MIEFILVVCMHFTCYISDDYSVVQMPIAHPEVHPDDSLREEWNGITIIAVPINQEI